MADLPKNPSPELPAKWRTGTARPHGEIAMAPDGHIGREPDAAEIAAIDRIYGLQAILEKEAASA